MSEHSPNEPNVPGEPFITTGQAFPAPKAPEIDGALAERLQKLAAARAQTGRSTIPPTSRTRTSLGTDSPATAVRTKRRHPAKYSRAGALALSVLASGGLGVFFAAGDAGVSAAPAEPAGLVTATPATTSSATTAPAATTPVATAAPVVVDPVVVNGDSFSNKWGNVQVQATFAADGTLTDVTTLEVPFLDGKSVRINNVAVPRLNSAALTAQSANVNTVSGATYTSNDYKKSLQSAIDIAVASGIPAVASA